MGQTLLYDFCQRSGAKPCQPELLQLGDQIQAGWWFGTWLLFSIYWECHKPNWLIFFRWVEATNQQDMFYQLDYTSWCYGLWSVVYITKQFGGISTWKIGSSIYLDQHSLGVSWLRYGLKVIQVDADWSLWSWFECRPLLFWGTAEMTKHVYLPNHRQFGTYNLINNINGIYETITLYSN